MKYKCHCGEIHDDYEMEIRDDSFDVPYGDTSVTQEYHTKVTQCCQSDEYEEVSDED